MEPLELSPALLQPQDSAVAIVGELLATLPREKEMLLGFALSLHRDIEEFTKELRATLYCTDDTWRYWNITNNDRNPLTSLIHALVAYESTPEPPPHKRGLWLFGRWCMSLGVLTDRWVQLAKKATKLRDTCKEVATEAANMAATTTVWARELQDAAARYGTAQENMVELGQALGREEGVLVVAEREALMRREAMEAASEATRVTMVRQWVEASLGLLERLVAACDEATAFPRELQQLPYHMNATVEERKTEASNVPKALVAKAAVAKRLWEANARQATRHLVRTFPDAIKFLFTGGPVSHSACGVAERCQRAIKDIPRLLQAPECPQSVAREPPVSMELQELSPALLQPQVTMVAILGELLDTLPRWDKEMMLLGSSGTLYRDLEDFTRGLRVTLYCIEGTWWHCNVSYNDDDPVTFLSQALAAYKSTPGTTRNRVIMAAGEWHRSAHALVNRWAKLAEKATKLHNTCWDLSTKAGTTTTRARELQDVAARDGTAQENMVELGQTLGREEGAEVVAGHEAQVRREAMVAASEATRATKVRQRLEVALGLLERLVAACDEATVFPRELQWRLRDIEAALKGTNEASPNVQEDLVAKVAEAEKLWEANACLAKGHLLGTLQDMFSFYFTGGPTSPSACGVAKWCQRAIEDIPRLLQPPEHPQIVPKVFPVSMELQKLSPALLQPQITVVATLGELLDTLPRRDEILLPVSALRLYWDLADFTRDLRVTLYCVDDTWWRRNVTSDDKDPVTTLSQALEAWESSPGITWNDVTMAASEWKGLVAVLLDRWTQLARAATKLHNTCRDVAAEAADRVGTARELQDWTALYVPAQENMVELLQALGKEEEAKEKDFYEAHVRREAMEAASKATRATMVRQQVEVALGLLEHLVAACDEATAFPRELQRRVGKIETTLKGTNEASPNVPEDLMAQVAEAKRLWEANARLAKDHLLRAVPDIIKFLFNGGPNSPCEVAERCQRAIEDIPRLLQPSECPQSFPKLSPALLQPQVTVVAILGELLDTLPRWDKEMMLLLPPGCLHRDLKEFTYKLWETMGYTKCLWYHCKDRDGIASPVTSLSRALAAYESIPWITWFNVTTAAREWHVWLFADSWAELARKATKLCNACREVVTEAASEEATATTRVRKLQEKAARDGTVLENMGELSQALGREEGAEVVAGHGAQVREQARVAATQATRATRRRQQLEVALEQLERLVAACNEATKFPRELQQRFGDIKSALKGTNEASPNVPKDLVAKVVEIEWLWGATTRLGKDHLLAAVDDIVKLYFNFVDNSSTGVAERCQRATKDIPRLFQPRPRPQGVQKVSPLSKELQELSPALLQPQVTVVAILGELLATLPRRDEEMMLFKSAGRLYPNLEGFTRDVRITLHLIKDMWWQRDVTSFGDDPLTSLSRALAASKSTAWARLNRVTMVASEWHRLVSELVGNWAWLARRATYTCEACRDLASEVADRAASTDTRARKLPDEVARDGTAQESMVELGQALGREEGAEDLARHGAQVRREARAAASEATRATMVRQRVEAALGLLERLAAACDEATAFPEELERLLGRIEAALKWTNEASPDVPEDLVAKVAVAGRLWEANARLAKDHLLGTLQDIIKFNGGPKCPSACEVAKRCQRAIEDIPRLLRPPECPQSIPRLSPVSMEPQELSPALLQPQVTVVAILDELLDTVPGWGTLITLLVSAIHLYRSLEEFTKELWDSLYWVKDTWWRRIASYDGGDLVTSLSQALATSKSAPWTTWDDATMSAIMWQWSVNVLAERWAELAKKATELRNTCRNFGIEAADMVASTDSRARELQHEAARYETVLENMVELGQALGREEGAEVVARREAQVREQARVAASEATRATVVRQRVEAALGLLERLVAACDEATAFPRQLQCLLRDIEAALKGTNEASPDVPEDLLSKVAVAERLWEANARLAEDHLLGAVQDLIEFYFKGHLASPNAHEVVQRCQRAIEDIPRLLPTLECPQSIPKVCPVSMEPQKLSPPQLQVLVAVVAILDKVVATLLWPHRAKGLHESPSSLHEDLRRFTRSLRSILDHGSVTSLGHSGVPTLRRALATLWTTPGTTRANVRAAAKAWRDLVAKLVDSWDWLAREATKLREKVVMEQLLMVALGKEEVTLEMATQDGQVAAANVEAMGEAVVATRRGHWAVVALGLLYRLVAACDKATLFYWNMEWRLRDIEAILKGTKEASPDVLQALMAKVAKFECLWEASTRLAKDHLLGTLGDIDNILLSPCGGCSAPGGPGSHTVAERCQKAIKDIPRLLQESFT
ncbi:uncharacterized protein LOC141725809 isoform X2 [Zonotrichia albicollis]|uniref:uncharacterized protein LOC141725809 isoform X2 n=1 Tax=Zonotrichia albicollis TaxID=44394 RepID=UPI003D8102C6